MIYVVAFVFTVALVLSYTLLDAFWACRRRKIRRAYTNQGVSRRHTCVRR